MMHLQVSVSLYHEGYYFSLRIPGVSLQNNGIIDIFIPRAKGE